MIGNETNKAGKRRWFEQIASNIVRRGIETNLTGLGSDQKVPIECAKSD